TRRVPRTPLLGRLRRAAATARINEEVVGPTETCKPAWLKGLGLGLEHSTPLWYYTLKEAELIEDGLHLGPVAGRIVAEVIIGLLHADPNSYLAYDPRWRPNLPSRDRRDCRITDSLTFPV